MIGARLSHFRIVGKLGEGGMGVVYRAEDERLRRPVALKVLPPELVVNEERRLRFLREARAAAAVSHPNIAAVYDVDEAEGHVFIAMELVEGKTLRQLIGGRPLAIKDVLHIAAEIAEGLAQAHHARVIHRDLKPENVMLRKDQHVKILDFGLAKLLEEQPTAGSSELSKLETISGEVTRAGRVLGTPAYMSPEQARGQPVDARSDIFAFGSTLYEMVTGSAPFHGRTPADTLSAIIRDEAVSASQVNPDVPPKLEEIISKCLEKDPQDRYQHADDVLVDLRRLKKTTDSIAQAARTPSGAVAAQPTRSPAQWLRSRSGKAAMAGVLILLAAVGGSIVWRSLRSPAGFRSGDRVLVTDLVGTTGSAELDVALRESLEDRLDYSMLLEVIAGEERKKLIGKRPGGEAGVVSHDVSKDLCADGLCAGYLVGEIHREGGGYLLETRFYRARQDAPLFTQKAADVQADRILTTLSEMIHDLRQSMGETSEAIAMTPPPTTSSLLAYQALIRGSHADSPETSVSLFKRALEIDPEFVRAYSYLADAYWNLGDWQGVRKAAEEAYRRSSGLPEALRLGIEAKFLHASYDFDTELERLKLGRQLHPLDSGWVSSLGFLYFDPFQDLISAEEAFYASYRPSLDAGSLSFLSIILACQGKADEIERLVADFRSKGGSEKWADRFLLWAYKVRGNDARIREISGRLEQEPGRLKVFALNSRSIWSLASGRLAEAERATALLWRASEQTRDVDHLFSAGERQSWLQLRRQMPVIPAADWADAVRQSLLYLPRLAAFSVDARMEEPLAGLIRQHELEQKGSKSRFVREELNFARGCLAIIRRENEKARGILEPLAPNSLLDRRHQMLGRTYEALGMWSEAADEYEKVVKNPHHKWWLHDVAAIPVLDQYRLAQIYERLGKTQEARRWYERFLADWKDADPDIPELIEARRRLDALGGAPAAPR